LHYFSYISIAIYTAEIHLPNHKLQHTKLTASGNSHTETWPLALHTQKHLLLPCNQNTDNWQCGKGYQCLQLHIWCT